MNLPSTEEFARRKVALAVVGNDIVEERWRQESKFGPDGTCASRSMKGGDGMKLAVLTEEVGEVARAIIEGEPVDHLRSELVQVAAVAAAWAESLTPMPGRE